MHTEVPANTTLVLPKPVPIHNLSRSRRTLERLGGEGAGRGAGGVRLERRAGGGDAEETRRPVRSWRRRAGVEREQACQRGSRWWMVGVVGGRAAGQELAADGRSGQEEEGRRARS
jgi:hypothetical protein